MLEILRQLISIQEQMEALRMRLASLMPRSGDVLVEICSQLSQTPLAVTEDRLVEPYQPLVPGFWIGCARTESIRIRQHVRTEDPSGQLEFSVSTEPDFESKWLTLEFMVGLTDIVTSTALSIYMEISGDNSGQISLALKAHGKNAKESFSQLAVYTLDSEALTISDVLPFSGACAKITEDYDDVRILIFLPPAKGATYTVTQLRLSFL